MGMTILPAFSSDAIFRGKEIILREFKITRSRFENSEVIMGITGGTNLMVASMTLAALSGKSRLFYVLKPSGSIAAHQIFEVQLSGEVTDSGISGGNWDE